MRELFSCIPGVPKKERSLINDRTKVFGLISQYFSILNKAYPKLDFKTKIVEIRWKLSEIYSFEVEHLKSDKPNFDDFWEVNFHISCKLYYDQLF